MGIPQPKKEIISETQNRKLLMGNPHRQQRKLTKEEASCNQRMHGIG